MVMSVVQAELCVMRGAALMEAYAELTGREDVTVEDLIVDLVAYRQAVGEDAA
jgi:hypothetical protein